MPTQETFELQEGTLSVNAPFLLAEGQKDEDQFLKYVDRLVMQRTTQLTIDLVRAGSLSSTVIALAIAASRKASAAGKTLRLRVAQRNRLAVKISGLASLVDVQFA